MNNQEFAVIVKTLTNNYQNFELTQETMKLWYGLFKTTHRDVFAAAIREHILTIKQAPNAASINECIAKVIEQADKENVSIDEIVKWVTTKSLAYGPSTTTERWINAIKNKFGEEVAGILKRYNRSFTCSEADLPNLAKDMTYALLDMKRKKTKEFRDDILGISYEKSNAAIEDVKSEREQKFLAMQQEIMED